MAGPPPLVIAVVLVAVVVVLLVDWSGPDRSGPHGGSVKGAVGDDAKRDDAKAPLAQADHSASNDAASSGAPPLAQHAGSNLASSSSTGPATVQVDRRPLASYVDQDHAQVAAVREASGSEGQMARLSGLVPAAPFDADKWQSDQDGYRAAYLSEVQPARVFNTQQPGPGVRALRLHGESEWTVEVDDTVVLQAQAEPGFPVSFISEGLGAFFPTGLTATTVVANDQGIAAVTWQAVQGTTGDVVVVAGSPVRSGTLHYHIFVADPQQYTGGEVPPTDVE